MSRLFGQTVFLLDVPFLLALDVVSCEGSYCGAHGYLYGNHSGFWLGQEATNLPIKLRYTLGFLGC